MLCIMTDFQHFQNDAEVREDVQPGKYKSSISLASPLGVDKMWGRNACQSHYTLSVYSLTCIVALLYVFPHSDKIQTGTI